MSSTIERRVRTAAQTLGLAGLIAVGWFTANAAILAATEKGDAVLVVFRHAPGAVALPEGVALSAALYRMPFPLNSERT